MKLYRVEHIKFEPNSTLPDRLAVGSQDEIVNVCLDELENVHVVILRRLFGQDEETCERPAALKPPTSTCENCGEPVFAVTDACADGLFRRLWKHCNGTWACMASGGPRKYASVNGSEDAPDNAC